MEKKPEKDNILEEEENDLESENEDLKSLMDTGHFENLEDAEVFLREINESLEIMDKGEEVLDEFDSDMRSLIKKAERQLEAIKEISEGDLVEEEDVFKQELLAIIEESSEQDDREKKKSLFNLPKRMGEFVRGNKRAFVAFGAFAMIARLGAGEAEASDLDDGELTENIIRNMNEAREAMEEEPFEELLDKNPSEDYSDVMEEIEEIKENPDAIFLSETYKNDSSKELTLMDKVRSFFGYDSQENYKEETSQNFNEEVNKLIEDSRSLKTVRVVSYHGMTDISTISTENEDVSAEYDSDMRTDMAIEEKKNPTGDLGEGIDFSGRGNTPEQALVSALKAAAEFQSTKISSFTGSHDFSYSGEGEDLSSSYIGRKIETSTDNTVTFRDAQIEKNDNYYEATIIIH